MDAFHHITPQPFNQSAFSRSRHNKNHVLPKHSTMLKSISCLFSQLHEKRWSIFCGSSLTFEVPFSHLLTINNGSICRFYFLVTETRVTLKRLSGHSFQVVKSDTLISVIASFSLMLVSTCQ